MRGTNDTHTVTLFPQLFVPRNSSLLLQPREPLIYSFHEFARSGCFTEVESYMYVLLGLAPLSQHGVFRAHPRRSACQSFITFQG